MNELDVDILAGNPFMSTNDTSVRPAKQQILIGDTNIVHCGTSPSDSPNRVRRTQAYILKPEATSVIWPGSYLELALPSDLQPECTLAIESRAGNVKFLNNWLPPSIIEAVSGKVRIPNNTDEPLFLRKNEHFYKIVSPQNSPVTILIVTYNYPSRLLLLQNSILTPSLLIPTRYFLYQTKFRTLTQAYNDVFDTKIQGYNGSMCPFEATINMGAIQPTPCVKAEFLNVPAISY